MEVPELVDLEGDGYDMALASGILRKVYELKLPLSSLVM